MLHVVESASKFSDDYGQGAITVESDIREPLSLAIEELQTIEARNLAIRYAASKGVSDPRVNGNTSSAYPVNVEGVPLEEVKDESGLALPAHHPKMQPSRYRVDIPICKRLV